MRIRKKCSICTSEEYEIPHKEYAEKKWDKGYCFSCYMKRLKKIEFQKFIVSLQDHIVENPPLEYREDIVELILENPNIIGWVVTRENDELLKQAIDKYYKELHIACIKYVRSLRKPVIPEIAKHFTKIKSHLGDKTDTERFDSKIDFIVCKLNTLMKNHNYYFAI